MTLATPLELDTQSQPPSGWDAALTDAGGVVFHSEAWAAYKVQEGGGEPLFCLWRDSGDGAVVGRALAIRRPSRDSLAGKLAAKLQFDSPPVGTLEGDFLSPLRAWARSAPALVGVGLGSFDALREWAEPSPPAPRARFEFVLPPGGVEEVWGEMRQLARRKVKRARKSDFETRLADSVADLHAFAAVHAETEERLRRTKGYVPGSRRSPEGFAAALEVLRAAGAGRLYAAYRGEQLEAGVVFATFAGRAYMIYSGATDAGRELGAPFLVLYDALCDLRGAGYATINLGGAGGDAAEPSSSEHGLYQFKTRFGAAAEGRTSGQMELRPLRAKAVALAQGAVRR